MTSEPQPEPSPQALSYLRWRAERPPVRERDMAAARRQMREEAQAFAGEGEPVAFVEDLRADGVPCRLYRPVGEVRDAFVWLHGGAWLLGDPDCYDAVARALANRAGCAVLSVDYRLAPEHPHPAAIEDCWTATSWALARFRRVAVGGDSAGGNLAAAVALRARDRGVELALQLLVYPVLDFTADSAAFAQFIETYRSFAGIEGFTDRFRERAHWGWDQYAPDPQDRRDQDVCPLRAETLAGVAPAVLITAEHDFLRLEDEAYARRLEADGVPVTLHAYAGQVHGFFHLLGLMDDARDAIERAGAAIRTALEA